MASRPPLHLKILRHKWDKGRSCGNDYGVYLGGDRGKDNSARRAAQVVHVNFKNHACCGCDAYQSYMDPRAGKRYAAALSPFCFCCCKIGACIRKLVQETCKAVW